MKRTHNSLTTTRKQSRSKLMRRIHFEKKGKTFCAAPAIHHCGVIGINLIDFCVSVSLLYACTSQDENCKKFSVVLHFWLCSSHSVASDKKVLVDANELAKLNTYV